MTDDHSTLVPLFSWRSAIADSTLASTTRHVALALSLYMNERGSSAFPGAERLAHDTAMHVSTIREHLTLLVDTGWLDLLERGGQRGERKRANSYRAAIPPTPLAHADPSNPPEPDTPHGHADPTATPTHRPGRADPSSSPRSPLVQDDPISSITLHRTLQGHPNTKTASQARRPKPISVAPPDPTTTQLATLIDGYALDYAATHSGARPPAEFTARIRKATRRELLNGTPATDLEVVLGVCAKENKTAVAHILADLHARCPT